VDLRLHRKSMVMIPGDIEVTGMGQSTVAGPELEVPTHCPGNEQVIVGLAPFETGTVAVGVRVQLFGSRYVPGIARRFVFVVAYA